MIDMLDDIRCTGCEACYNVCPVDAIQMIENQEGFFHPRINKETCIHCNLCEKSCPLLDHKDGEQKKAAPDVYAAYSREDYVRFHSTSGGIFSELAVEIINQGGYVAGSMYQNDFSAAHFITGQEEQLELLRRSKYQQSRIYDIYKKIRKLLKGNETVLFSGTPCQVAGLKHFLGNDFQNLYTSDFICRGVNSPMVFKAYVKMLEHHAGSKLQQIWMKYKKNGWHSLGTYAAFENGREYYRNGMEDSFVRMTVLYNNCIRRSCFHCEFKENNSCADITLGDFWGLEGDDMDDNQGTSAVIVRTDKGKQLFSQIVNNIHYKEYTLNQLCQGNPCYENSLEKKSLETRNQFFTILQKSGYEKAYQFIREENG